jgi:hypothetical protein
LKKEDLNVRDNDQYQITLYQKDKPCFA